MQSRLNAHYLPGGSVNEGCWSCTWLHTILHFFKIHLKLVLVFTSWQSSSTAAVCLSSKTQIQDGIFMYFSIKHLKKCCAAPLDSHLCLLVMFFIDLITFVLHEGTWTACTTRLNFFFPADISTRHSRISLHPNFSIIHLQLLNLLVKWTGFFFSPVFQSCSVFPLLLTFPSSSGCVLAGSQIKRCIMFLNQLCMAELHRERGVSMNQLKCPTGVAVTFMCCILTSHRRKNWMWGWVECNGEFSGGFFNLCIFAQRPAQPSWAAVLVSGEQAGRFKV